MKKSRVHPREYFSCTVDSINIDNKRSLSYSNFEHMPEGEQVLSFELRQEANDSLDQSFLILDNYGDEFLGDRLRKRLVGPKYQFLAIETTGIRLKNRSDITNSTLGKIFSATFSYEKEKTYEHLTLELIELEHVIPEEYLSRILELQLCKRPFYYSLPEYQLLEFIEQESSLSDLQQHLVITLNFDNEYLQIQPDGTWRSCSKWNSNV